jgi:hypothetical protein
VLLYDCWLTVLSFLSSFSLPPYVSLYLSCIVYSVYCAILYKIYIKLLEE